MHRYACVHYIHQYARVYYIHRYAWVYYTHIYCVGIKHMFSLSQIIKDGAEYEDLSEVAKLFDLHENPMAAEAEVAAK